ncbi:MAG: FAD-dependent oxidoreductase [Acidimicrobiales bacterium]
MSSSPAWATRACSSSPPSSPAAAAWSRWRPAPRWSAAKELGRPGGDPDGWRNFLIPFDDLARLDAVRTVHGSIERIDPDRRIVHVARAAGGRVLLPYDVLVVARVSATASGATIVSRTWPMSERGIDEVAQRLAAARTVAVIGGGATGVSVAANLAMRGVVPDVHLFHSGDQPLRLPGADARRRIVAEARRRRGAHRHPGHRAIVPDGFRGERLTSRSGALGDRPGALRR